MKLGTAYETTTKCKSSNVDIWGLFGGHLKVILGSFETYYVGICGNLKYVNSDLVGSEFNP